jgi:hypothetical protein
MVSYLNVTLNFAFQQSLNCELLSYRFAFANEPQILVFITHSKIFHSNPEYKIDWLVILQESLIHVGVAIR